MGQAELSGTLTLGPAGSGSSSFPTSQDLIALAFSPTPKPNGVMTGGLQANVASPTVFVILPGIGVSPATVTHCTLLYIKGDGVFTLRLTTLDPAGGADVVAVVPVQGLAIIEFPESAYLKLLEVKGSVRLEYAAAGLV